MTEREPLPLLGVEISFHELADRLGLPAGMHIVAVQPALAHGRAAAVLVISYGEFLFVDLAFVIAAGVAP
jgi:hypothetical protein